VIKFRLFGSSNNEETKRPHPPEATTQEALPCPDVAGIPLEGKRVLIVDDDVMFLRVAAAKLQSAGFHVRTAREGSGAIAALGEEPVDAVLMDINFPPDVCNGGMGSWDGFQIMTWLRGNPGAKGARFFMVSVSDCAADRQRAQRTGAVAYFQKPLEYDRLLASMKAEN
jgi:CheY-like chemotaxis protein